MFTFDQPLKLLAQQRRIPSQSSSQGESDRNVNADLVTSHTCRHTHQHTHTACCRTSCDGSYQRLDGDGPGVVPGPDDEHHSQRLRLDEDGVRHGHQVLRHGPRGRPLLQLLDGQAELPLQTQSLVQLCPHIALGVKITTLSLLMAEVLLIFSLYVFIIKPI